MFVCLQIWDTAGQERFHGGSLGSGFFRGANAALLVYDVACAVSFEQVRRDIMMRRDVMERRDVMVRRDVMHVSSPITQDVRLKEKTFSHESMCISVG